MQIISTFDHDHGPFGVSVDGQPAGSGDTFSADPGCSVAWTSQPLNWGNHTIVGTVHPTTDHVFVELLGIVCVVAVHAAFARVDKLWQVRCHAALLSAATGGDRDLSAATEGDRDFKQCRHYHRSGIRVVKPAAVVADRDIIIDTRGHLRPSCDHCAQYADAQHRPVAAFHVLKFWTAQVGMRFPPRAPHRRLHLRPVPIAPL